MIKNLDNLKIEKILGSGMFGTTYLVIYNSKKYAMKIEHILKKDIKKRLSSHMWREIEFAKFMGKKYPAHFLTLYGYDIIENCVHIQKRNKILSTSLQKKFTLFDKSPYCSRKIYSLIDNTLHNIKDTLKINEIYGAIIQISYILYLMDKHGYTHNDFHSQNIGIKKTKQKYITIFGNKIPTFGKMYVSIDYGNILHKKYKLTVEEKYILNNQKFIRNGDILFKLMFNDPLKIYIKKNNIQIPSNNYIIKKLKKYDIYFILESFTHDINLQYILCHILFPNIWQKIIFDKKHPQTELTLEYKIPQKDIIYTILNMYDYKSISKYFSVRLNTKNK